MSRKRSLVPDSDGQQPKCTKTDEADTVPAILWMPGKREPTEVQIKRSLLVSCDAQANAVELANIASEHDQKQADAVKLHGEAEWSLPCPPVKNVIVLSTLHHGAPGNLKHNRGASASLNLKYLTGPILCCGVSKGGDTTELTMAKWEHAIGIPPVASAVANPGGTSVPGGRAVSPVNPVASANTSETATAASSGTATGTAKYGANDSVNDMKAQQDKHKSLFDALERFMSDRTQIVAHTDYYAPWDEFVAAFTKWWTPLPANVPAVHEYAILMWFMKIVGTQTQYKVYIEVARPSLTPPHTKSVLGRYIAGHGLKAHEPALKSIVEQKLIPKCIAKARRARLKAKAEAPQDTKESDSPYLGYYTSDEDEQERLGDSHDNREPYSVHTFNEFHRRVLNRRYRVKKVAASDIGDSKSPYTCVICRKSISVAVAKGVHDIPDRIPYDSTEPEKTKWIYVQGLSKSWNAEITHLSCFASVHDQNFPLFA